MARKIVNTLSFWLPHFPWLNASKIDTEYFALDSDLVAPSLFFVSPTQLWIGPLISRVNITGTIEEDWLPKFRQSTAHLRRVLVTVRQHGNLRSFISHRETGGMLFLGGVLEIMSAVSSLAAPLILHSFIQTPENALLAGMLVAATLMATVCGRAKDEVCRVHAAWIEAMLRSTIFQKGLLMSPEARLRHSAAKLISINAVDIGFLTNYVLKVHDIWSAPLQIIGIAVLTVNLMGWTGLVGFGLVGLIFVNQTFLGRQLGKAAGGYVSQNDRRLGDYRDMLGNIKSVKAGGLETVFERKIEQARHDQLTFLRSYMTTSFAIFTAVNQITPYLAACSAFLAYALSGATLTSDVVFPCLTYFQLLYQPVTQASLAFSRQYSVRPSLTRVREVLNAKESERRPADSEDESATASISFESAVLSWRADLDTETVSLKLGDTTIPTSQLTAVVGRNGAGKSSFLQAILGEMDVTEGTRLVNGSIAYCPQEPWIMSGTLRDNIVFNSSRGYDARRYENIIRACCLDEEFANEPGGITGAPIGEAGSNLSGGQRARISLARALYSDADILLLDDPLSAVDVLIRSRLFDTIRSLNRTVVLVTLHTHYVSQVDYVVVLNKMNMIWAGPKSDFMALTWRSKYVTPSVNDTEAEMLHGHGSDVGSGSMKPPMEDVSMELLQAEERAHGAVRWDVVKFFFRLSGGRGFAMFVIVMIGLLTASKVFSQYWFVWWIGKAFPLSQDQYMAVFLGLTLAQGAVTAIFGVVLVAGSMKAAQSVHNTILANLINAPLWFFYRNPTGRILNRLSKDIEAIDARVMNAFDGLLVAGTTMLASLAIVATSGVVLLAAVVPFLAVVSWWLQRFRTIAREVQRLDSVLQSPALSILTECLQAVPSIKAYGAADFLINRHGTALDLLTATKILRSSLDTWITFRAEVAAAIVLLVLSILTLRGAIPHINASLALATATTLARHVYLLAWAATDLEIQLNAVERLQEYYDHIPVETQAESSFLSLRDDHDLESFAVSLIDVSLRYGSRNSPALDGISLKIKRGEKVGIIGRTGSGKSSLISTLARLVDIQQGHIYINGLEIASINPQHLRQSVVTLPQESLVLSGTIRANVDPYNMHKDEQIWAALEACQMSTILKTKYGANALDREISAQGADLSFGQRQLLCAARVLLGEPTILLVDEASANVDFASDEALQRAWQSLPEKTTMIGIAHRPESLAWMDRVIVMENGRIVEDGSPLDLLHSVPSNDGKVGKISEYAASVQRQSLGAYNRALETAQYWNYKRSH